MLRRMKLVRVQLPADGRLVPLILVLLAAILRFVGTSGLDVVHTL